MQTLTKAALCLHTLLTKQEKVIVSMLAEGLTSKEIADRLYICPGTVENHRKNMLKKTGTKNIAQLVALSVRSNVI